MAKATAKVNYLHVAPRKVRLIASLLRGLSVRDAEAELMFRPNRAAEPIRKLLQSALNNAKNLKLSEEKLIISDIRVDQGPMYKRFLPRARGSASPIQKKMSHVFIVLEESAKALPSRFVIPKPLKKEKKEKPKRSSKKEAAGDAVPMHDEAAPTGAEMDKRKISREHSPERVARKGFKGFTQKLFSRKSGGGGV